MVNQWFPIPLTYPNPLSSATSPWRNRGSDWRLLSKVRRSGLAWRRGRAIGWSSKLLALLALLPPQNGRFSLVLVLGNLDTTTSLQVRWYHNIVDSSPGWFSQAPLQKIVEHVAAAVVSVPSFFKVVSSMVVGYIPPPVLLLVVVLLLLVLLFLLLLLLATTTFWDNQTHTHTKSSPQCDSVKESIVTGNSCSVFFRDPYKSGQTILSRQLTIHDGRQVEGSQNIFRCREFAFLQPTLTLPKGAFLFQ